MLKLKPNLIRIFMWITPIFKYYIQQNKKVIILLKY